MLSKTAIGIKIKGGEDLIISAVTDFHDDDKNATVEIKPVSLYGHEISRTHLKMEDIQGVVPFSVLYDDPLYVRLRKVGAAILNNQSIR